MKRSALALLAVLAAALLVAGCGGGSSSSSSSTTPAGGASKQATAPDAPAGSKVVSCGGSGRLRATVVDCATARATMEQWEGSEPCAAAEGSRSSCSLGAVRCQAVRAGKGISVSCVGPEGDVAFIVRPAG